MLVTDINNNLSVLKNFDEYLKTKGINNFDDLIKVLQDKGINSSQDLSNYILSDKIDLNLAILLKTFVQEMQKVQLNHRIDSKIFRSSDTLGTFIQSRFRGLEQEELKAYYFNTKNKLIAEKTIFKGTNNKSIVHPRDIFKWALIYNANNLIVAHNHPSGDITPSYQDRKCIDNLVKASEEIDIKLLDSFVVSDNDHFSFAEAGLLG